MSEQHDKKLIREDDSIFFNDFLVPSSTPATPPKTKFNFFINILYKFFPSKKSFPQKNTLNSNFDDIFNDPDDLYETPLVTTTSNQDEVIPPLVDTINESEINQLTNDFLYSEQSLNNDTALDYDQTVNTDDMDFSHQTKPSSLTDIFREDLFTPSFVNTDAFGLFKSKSDVIATLISTLNHVNAELHCVDESTRSVILRHLNRYVHVLQGRGLTSVQPQTENESYAFMQLELESCRRNTQNLLQNMNAAKNECDKAVSIANTLRNHFVVARTAHRVSCDIANQTLDQLKQCIISHPAYNEPTNITGLNTHQLRIIAKKYPLLSDLALATQSEILSTSGIGPASYEKIINHFNERKLACVANATIKYIENILSNRVVTSINNDDNYKWELPKAAYNNKKLKLQRKYLTGFELEMVPLSKR